MIVKTAKVSAKGQLTLPVEVLRAMNLRKGSELVLVQEGDRVILRKTATIGREILDELANFEALAAPTFARVWDNEADEVWDDA